MSDNTAVFPYQSPPLGNSVSSVKSEPTGLSKVSVKRFRFASKSNTRTSFPAMVHLNEDLRDKTGGKTGILVEFLLLAEMLLYKRSFVRKLMLMNRLYLAKYTMVLRLARDFWVLRAAECDRFDFLYRLGSDRQLPKAVANVSAGSKDASKRRIVESDFTIVLRRDPPMHRRADRQWRRASTDLDSLITLHQRKYDGCANPLFLERRISCRKPSHQNRCSATTTPSG